MLEKHTRRPVQLRNDDALCPVDHERTGNRHERYFAHVHFLLLDLLNSRLRRLPIHDRQPDLGAQRTCKSQAALLALLDVEGRLTQGVRDEIEFCIARMRCDRKIEVKAACKPSLLRRSGGTLACRNPEYESSWVASRTECSGQQRAWQNSCGCVFSRSMNRRQRFI